MRYAPVDTRAASYLKAFSTTTNTCSLTRLAYLRGLFSL